MSIFTGLNVALHLNDVNNPNESLRNLGLDRRDFDHIRGLSAVLETRNQLQESQALQYHYHKWHLVSVVLRIDMYSHN